MVETGNPTSLTIQGSLAEEVAAKLSQEQLSMQTGDWSAVQATEEGHSRSHGQLVQRPRGD